MIFICILLMINENGAYESPITYGFRPYSYNSFHKPTTVTPDSEESSEEDSDSNEYVICTCETCTDVSCEEYCKSCPQNDPRVYKERTYENIQYYDRSNPIQNKYERIALRTLETTPTNKAYDAVLNIEKIDQTDNENKIYQSQYLQNRNIVTFKQNEIETDFDSPSVQLTYHKAKNDIINIEFLLNDRDKMLKKETYVNTPIRRTKVNINEYLTDTHYRNTETLHS